MSKVRIITDITAQLDPDFVTRYRITVLPVQIRYGDQTHIFGPGDSTLALFQEMAEGPAKPSEATVPAKVFQNAFQELCQQTEDILVILGSSKLSNAYAEAMNATLAFLGRCHITVLDTSSASWGLALIVKSAVEAAEQGQPLDEIVRLVRGLLPHIYVVFFVERLDYLEGRGRIGLAQALLGTMLRIKPILLLEEGDIIPLEKVRTSGMALEKVANFVAEFSSLRQVAIMHSPLLGKDSQLVSELQNLLGLSLPNFKFPTVEYDPVLACHLGPEALGVAVFEKI